MGFFSMLRGLFFPERKPKGKTSDKVKRKKDFRIVEEQQLLQTKERLSTSETAYDTVYINKDVKS